MTTNLRDLLELASDDVPEADLATEAWEEARRRHRVVVRRTVLAVGAVAAAGAVVAVVVAGGGATGPSSLSSSPSLTYAGSGNSATSTPLSAPCMKAVQTAAGKEPPVTVSRPPKPDRLASAPSSHSATLAESCGT